MIFFRIILHPAVLIYDFHIFITSIQLAINNSLKAFYCHVANDQVTSLCAFIVPVGARNLHTHISPLKETEMELCLIFLPGMAILAYTMSVL